MQTTRFIQFKTTGIKLIMFPLYQMTLLQNGTRKGLLITANIFNISPPVSGPEARCLSRRYEPTALTHVKLLTWVRATGSGPKHVVQAHD